MRKVGLALIAVAAVASFATPAAYAGSSCKWIAAMCPAELPGDKDKDHGHHTSVPEPATLTLLGAGVAAVGAAIARRRKKNS